MKEINVKAGDITFAQRLELGRIFTSKLSEIQMFEQSIFLLHGSTPSNKEYSSLMPYFYEIMSGTLYWIVRERTSLSFNSEGLELPICEVNSVTEDKDTICKIADLLNIDVDKLLNMPYREAFTLMLEENEQYGRLISCFTGDSNNNGLKSK